jgi:farnesyl diphosphate synthase
MPVDTIDRLASELEAETAQVSADVDSFFSELLAPSGDSRDRLFEAMRHGAIGGGKRLVRDQSRAGAPRRLRD